MAMMDGRNRPRDMLPSISHLDLDRIKSDRDIQSKQPIMSTFNGSAVPQGSPNTIYSGPPPPYSCASSTVPTTFGLSGYISPPESTTRRSTRDEIDSPTVQKSLPSIHEALGDKTMMSAPKSLPPPLPPSAPVGAVPATTLAQSFPDAPQGPRNPFAQSANVPPVHNTKDVYRTSNTTTATPKVDTTSSRDPPGAHTPYDGNSLVGQHHPSYPASPHHNTTNRHSTSTFTSLNSPHPAQAQRSPYPTESHESFRFPSYPQSQPFSTSSFQFDSSKFDGTNNPFVSTNPSVPYGETVKRHLDVFDAELSLNEINEASARTQEFSQHWLHKQRQSNRSAYAPDSVPTLHEIDEVIRNSHRVIENLMRIREAVIVQQTALSEERARAAQVIHASDDFHGMADEHRSGGFAGGDAKKRRGKAAPPGRCHSCNRAETPEWRRGPDGARTLCNACGLHYAKLTRKLGANKAGTLTGSNLRPKNLESRASFG